MNINKECLGLIIFGAGGHAKSVADVAITSGITQVLFIDEGAKKDETIFGFPVLQQLDELLPDGWWCFPAVGDHHRRKSYIDFAQRKNWPVATLISPSATIGMGAKIETGCFIGHHAHVGPMAYIGTGTIINTAAVVEHEVIIGNYCHISINASIGGCCQVGDNSYVFAGAAVRDKISISNDVTIGAGSTVIKSIITPGVYVGSPVTQIKESIF